MPLYDVEQGKTGSPTDLNQAVDALSGKNDIGSIQAFNQIAVPTAVTAAVNTTSGNLSGPYQYKVAFLTGYWQGPVSTGTLHTQGNTGGGAASNTVSPSGQQIDLSNIPVGPTGTVARVLYRTKSGGSTLYFVTQIDDNTTTSWTDNIADTALGAVMPTTNTTGTKFSGDGSGLSNMSASQVSAIPATDKGSANGVATLDANAQVPASQLDNVPNPTPASIGAVANAGSAVSIQAGTQASKPAAGTAGRIYIETDTARIMRDDGSAWQKVGVVNWADLDGTPTTISGYGITDAVRLNQAQTWTAAQTFASDTHIKSNGTAANSTSKSITFNYVDSNGTSQLGYIFINATGQPVINIGGAAYDIYNADNLPSPAQTDVDNQFNAQQTFNGGVKIPNGASLTLPSAGGQTIWENGTADAAGSYANYDVALRLWWGWGLKSFDDVVRSYFDSRLGKWDALGGFYVNGARTVEGVSGQNIQLQESGGTLQYNNNGGGWTNVAGVKNVQTGTVAGPTGTASTTIDVTISAVGSKAQPRILNANALGITGNTGSSYGLAIWPELTSSTNLRIHIDLPSEATDLISIPTIAWEVTDNY